MGKVTFTLPIRGGRGQPNETEDQRLKPHLHEGDLPDYSEFPYSTFFPEDRGKSKDPLLDKSSPEYRKRVKETLDALQDEYQRAYKWYKECNQIVLAAKEERDQLFWNMAVLDLRNVARYMRSENPVHKSVGKMQSEIRDRIVDSPEYRLKLLACQTHRFNLFKIEMALEVGLRELARLDGADSDAFRQLRNMWARRQSRNADDVSQPSTCWSHNNVVDD
ncbi:hypothetical protein N0V84_009007 [Fusarium piperis]|uniref:Uncharacterized protein n=1 Tax=Fusarium piperis TaxID=1435070 RepID=A0A9W8W735_9HYPO|nr:hypothetical protein N0V84_009007 [Fusarium piperis]